MSVLTEHTVIIPIRNPDTGRAMNHWKYGGKLDRLEPGKLTDWKSAADPARFIKLLTIGYQLDLYVLLAQAEKYTVTEVEYRIVKTPSIKLCGKDNNDTEQYEERCFSWILAQDDGLTEHSLFVTESRLDEARRHLYDVAKRINEARKTDRWIPNTYACYLWERECAYLPLCERRRDGNDSSIDYMNGIPLHPELDSNDSSLLTHTSASTFCSCEVKYHWQFERGLRKGHDYTEPLWLGSAMHAGLEGYADGGLAVANVAIDEWVALNPILGPEANQKQDQQTARARAMVRAAAEKWPIMPEANPEDNGKLAAELKA